MKPFTQSNSYRDFVNARSRALEDSLLICRGKLATLQAQFQKDVIQTITSMLIQYAGNKDSYMDIGALQRILHDSSPIVKSVQEIMRFRVFAYTLAYRSEAQAVHMVRGTEGAQKITHDEVVKIATSDMFGFGDVRHTVRFAYDKLIRKILDAFQAATIIGLEPEEVLDRVQRSMPSAVLRSKIKRLKRATREAKKPDVSTDFFDDAEWEDLVDDYLRDTPITRSPEGKLEEPVTTSEGDVLLYDWELERAVTEDFVEKVRLGQIEAATKAGVTDFVWVAILDAKTCEECCQKRDGLLVSEIEKNLKGKWKKDDCQATVPPAHFNCRCDIAPADDDIPDSPPNGREEFDDWLNKT